MKFGLFFNPVIRRRPGNQDWDPDRERRAFTELVEQVRFADSLGIDYVFLGEHHFMPEYAHNSAPEVLLGALSQVTKRIRLGTGIVHASHNDPVRTAERIATLDQLSGGRVEFGFGPGGDQEIAPLMPRAFRDRKREIAAAAGLVSVDVLATRGFWPGIKNEFFDYPGVNVVPKSFQVPHPPLWSSATTPGTTVPLAQRGLGVLMLATSGPEETRRDIEAYWAALRSPQVRPVGRGINPAVFVFASGIVARTDEEAEKRVRAGLEFFGYGLTGGAIAGVSNPEHHLYQAFLDFKAGKHDIRQDAPFPPGMKEFMLDMGNGFAESPGVIMGGPEKARRYIRAYEPAHPDGMLFRYDFDIAHEHAMEALEILAREVIPEFRERHAGHVAWRKEQLASIPHPVVTSL